jgi:starch synthase
MKILHVASEVTPFAKTGGLADVVGTLPVALQRLGHDVRIITPYHRAVEFGGGSIRRGRKSVEVSLNGGVKKGGLRIGELAGLPVYFVENREFFRREGLYGTAAGDYPDNPERFAFFCRAALDFCKRLDFRPDIIHCHDWQSALIPFLLRHELKDDLFFKKCATLYTIHNLAYQGLFSAESLPQMGLDWSCFTLDQLEYYGSVNLMKGGILSADLVTTVSPTYLGEIQTPEMGRGLDGVLRQRSGDLYGIVNGIDLERWNPGTDPDLAKTYTVTAPAGKRVVKEELRKELGLEQREAPLLGMVSRIVSQKGFDLLVQLLPRLEAADLDLVVLGLGDERYLRKLATAGERSSRIKLCTGNFNESLAHRIYAGSDLFLMPSHYEPCGLSQLIAFRYGSVPIVRNTGGLADTVTDAAQPGGNGFVFQEQTVDAFWEAIRRALDLYERAQEWKKLVRRGMRTDVSWSASARRYEELYGAVVTRRRERG